MPLDLVPSLLLPAEMCPDSAWPSLSRWAVLLRSNVNRTACRATAGATWISQWNHLLYHLMCMCRFGSGFGVGGGLGGSSIISRMICRAGGNGSGVSVCESVVVPIGR